MSEVCTYLARRTQCHTVGRSVYPPYRFRLLWPEKRCQSLAKEPAIAHPKNDQINIGSVVYIKGEE